MLFLVVRHAARRARGPSAAFQVRAAFYTAIVPLALIVLVNLHRTVWRGAVPGPWDRLYVLYLGALAAHLALLALVFDAGTPWLRAMPPARALRALALGLLGALPVGLLAAPAGSGAPPRAALAAALPALALGLYLAANRLLPLPRERPWDGRLQAASVALAALLLAPLLPLLPP